MRPVLLIRPPRCSAATTSSTPDPHKPTAGLSSIVRQHTRPPSSQAFSIAPSAARMPQETCPPSSAGPDGEEAE